MSDATYVVVGGGPAGARAVEALRAEGVDGRVIMIGEEPELPYTRPALSKGYLAGRTDRAGLTVLGDSWYAAHDVELLIGRRARSIDLGAQTVRLDHSERVGYDRLLLATGSDPRRLDVPGADLDGVHYLRRAQDADAIRAALSAGEPMVVIGGGWVGLEVAAVARSLGLEVTIVTHAPAPMHRTLGKLVGNRLVELHRAHGVTVHTGRRIAAITGSGRVEVVELADGTRIEAGAVVVDIGAEPRSELAREAGLKVDDGVVVDGGLRTEDPRIWAAGDLAMADNAWVGSRVRNDHFANAEAQGMFAGRSMAGALDSWSDAPWYRSEMYSSLLVHRGWADPKDTRVVIRDGGDGRWTAVWLTGDRMAAAMRCEIEGVPEVDARTVENLVVERAAVDVGRLTDPTVPWAEIAT